MSTEPKRVTKTEAWTAWESQVVNGVWPLRRFLGGTHHGGVFLSEYQGKSLPDVAIKLVPADTLRAQGQLGQWSAAAARSHPHLIRLFEVGQCQLGGRGFLFVVMEYAEQTLAQILPRRALTPDEVREMLPPMLDALAFLHLNQLVQGQLKPSNVLVVDDQLKLASDTSRPTGHFASGVVRRSLYDPPELSAGTICTAGDIWALGITLVEALTQRTWAWSGEPGQTASLLASLPAPFADTVRRCLSRTPANRPTVLELQAQYGSPPQAQVIPAHQPSASQVPAREARPPAPQVPVQESPPPAREAGAARNVSRTHLLSAAIAGALLIVLIAWFALRSSHPGPIAPSAALPAAPAAPSLGPSPVVKPAQPGSALPSAERHPPDRPATAARAAPSSSVLHEVTPEVRQSILDGIHGHIKVMVRVLVDPSGNVAGHLVEKPGPSRYFARRADEAAAEWKFAPADVPGSRVWRLHFDFSRGGVTAQASAVE